MIRVRPLEQLLANPGRQIPHLDLSSFKMPQPGNMSDASQQEQKEEAPSHRGSLFGGSTQSIGHSNAAVHSTELQQPAHMVTFGSVPLLADGRPQREDLPKQATVCYKLPFEAHCQQDQIISEIQRMTL